MTHVLVPTPTVSTPHIRPRHLVAAAIGIGVVATVTTAVLVVSDDGSRAPTRAVPVSRLAQVNAYDMDGLLTSAERAAAVAQVSASERYFERLRAINEADVAQVEVVPLDPPLARLLAEHEAAGDTVPLDPHLARAAEAHAAAIRDVPLDPHLARAAERHAASVRDPFARLRAINEAAG